MARVFGAQWILLMLGSVGSTGCMAGTTFVPGDPSRFDPVARLPEVAAYAGVSAKFLALLARDVREDGTIDLDAPYITSYLKPVSYTFVQLQPSSDDTNVPVGARTAERPKVVAVFVTVGRAVFENEDEGAFRGGMSRTTGSTDLFHNASELRHLQEPFDTPTPPPRCSFAELWAIARQRGAPAGAVAVIVYDPTGYRFRIDGTPFKLEFDANCTVKS